MSRRMIPAAIAMVAALGVPPLPQVEERAPDEPAPEPAPQINPRTGKPFRGIPTQAARKADPVRMRYANGPQPEPIRKMLKDRRAAAARMREQERAKHRAAAAVSE